MRRQGGFSFIEILVVMGIIAVLAAGVVALVPFVQERGNRNTSLRNLRQLGTLLIGRAAERRSGKYPKYDGKNFTLSPLALGLLSGKDERQLLVFFSPGDEFFTIEDVEVARYGEVKKDALKAGTDFHELTSYAGRRNGDKAYVLTQGKIGDGDSMLMCDDDEGNLHHSEGVCAVFADGGAQFLNWEELGMQRPDDTENPAPFLGDEATSTRLESMSSD